MKKLFTSKYSKVFAYYKVRKIHYAMAIKKLCAPTSGKTAYQEIHKLNEVIILKTAPAMTFLSEKGKTLN